MSCNNALKMPAGNFHCNSVVPENIYILII